MQPDRPASPYRHALLSAANIITSITKDKQCTSTSLLLICGERGRQQLALHLGHSAASNARPSLIPARTMQLDAGPGFLTCWQFLYHCRSDQAAADLKINFVSDKPSSWYAELYQRDQLTGGHVIMLGADDASRWGLGF
jgi:hypothetical protein